MGPVKEFKSIHIDLEKKIYLLNGEPMKNVFGLDIEARGRNWSLRVNRDEIYEAPLRKAKTSDQ